MTRPKSPTGAERPLSDAWPDRVSQPSVHESDTESAWAEFNAIDALLNAHFAATQPASDYPETLAFDLENTAVDPTAFGEFDDRVVTLERAMLVARQNNRVCPLPRYWAKLYEMLPLDETDPAPSRPVGLSAWSSTSAMHKRLVLREHIQWAAAHGVLDDVYAFLCALDEQCWLHVSQEPPRG